MIQQMITFLLGDSGESFEAIERRVLAYVERDRRMGETFAEAWRRSEDRHRDILRNPA